MKKCKQLKLYYKFELEKSTKKQQIILENWHNIVSDILEKEALHHELFSLNLFCLGWTTPMLLNYLRHMKARPPFTLSWNCKSTCLNNTNTFLPFLLTRIFLGYTTQI